jgi:hypothetical protein
MITRAFGRDERPFILKCRGWREVEKTCDAGLGIIAARLAPVVRLVQAGVEGLPGGLLAAIAAGNLGSARLDDVREVLLQALIDGGMSSTEAGALVRLVFDEAIAAGKGPMLLYAGLAFDIVASAIIGLEDEPLGEPKGAVAEAVTPPRRSRAARRGSPTSTASPSGS